MESLHYVVLIFVEAVNASNPVHSEPCGGDFSLNMYKIKSVSFILTGVLGNSFC